MATFRMAARAILGATCAAALIGIYAGELAGRVTLHAAFVWSLVLLPLLAAVLPRGETSLAARPIIEGRRDFLSLVAIIALGAVVRGFGIASFPPVHGQLWEETQTGKVALESIRYGSLDPYFPATNLLGEVGFRVFGVSLVALRLPFVAIAIASVGAFFLAARLLLRTPAAAFLATVLFAGNAFLAGAARVALETMSPIFTECVALAAAFYATTRRSAAAFAFAGFATGLLALEYFSYKLLPPLVFAFIALAAADPSRAAYCNRRSRVLSWAALRDALPRLVLFGWFAVAAMLPVLISDPTKAQEFFLEGWRRQQAGIASETVGASVWGALELAFERVVASASFAFLYGGNNDLLPDGRGILDLFTGVIGTAALVHCAWFARRNAAKAFLSATALLLVFLAGVLVGNPARYRLAPLVPICLLAIGVLIDDALRAPRSSPRFLFLISTCVVAVAAFNLHVFAAATRDPGVRAEFFDPNLMVVAEIARVQRTEASAVVYLVSDRDYLGHSNDYEFLYERARVKVLASAADLPADAVHVIAHDRFATELAQARDLSRAACQRSRSDLGDGTVLSCRLALAVNP